MKRSRFTEEPIIGILKEFEYEDHRLEKMYADVSMENHSLKDLIDRKL